jgi:hypothetical protein
MHGLQSFKRDLGWSLKGQSSSPACKWSVSMVQCSNIEGAPPLPTGYGISQFDSGEFHFPVACQESKSEILAILAGSLL